MNLAERFGENLKRARKRGGYSQEGLAVRASLHRTEVGLLERGERMARIDTALKLAGAVDVPLGELLAGIEWSPGTFCPGRFETAQSGGEAAGGPGG
jgi:transcriptional regulator with XRE-family HTH domain